MNKEYKNSLTILDVVNQQIEKYFKGSAVVYQYVGVVEGFSGSMAKVRLVGHDTVFTFPVRSYLLTNTDANVKYNIKVGDSVYVQCKLNNLSNGVVVDKFYGEG